jgi:hypothetical protein
VDLAVVHFDELVGPGMPRIASSNRFFVSGYTGRFGDQIEDHTPGMLVRGSNRRWLNNLVSTFM